MDETQRIGTAEKAVARRRFFGAAARAAGGAVAAAMLLALHVQGARALPAAALRPPGALGEKDFLAACLRCGLCVRACPYDTLDLARFGGMVAVGTPYFVARQVPCEMCEHVPCVKACPSGALAPDLTRIEDARMGLAVLIDRETCLNAQGLRCDVCYRVCPLRGQAITLDRQHNVRTGAHAVFMPVVHSDKCTGCGKCEKACVLEESAIRILPRHLAKGEIGGHYRLGWEEKKKLGRPLVEGIEDPVRRQPEAVPSPAPTPTPGPGGRS